MQMTERNNYMPIADKIKKGLSTSTYATKAAEESLALQKKYGTDKIFDLSVSNPVLEPPQEFVKELQNFIDVSQNGKHRYMENAGYTANRMMVADKLKQETGIDFSLSEIIMTCGSSGALNIIFKAIFNPGEELIVFAPFYPEYIPYVENYFGVCRIVPAVQGFIPDLKAFESAITPKTKAVIINSPNNPTGLIYSDDALATIADILTRKGAEYHTTIYAISDETYYSLVYDGDCPRMFSHYVNTISLTSYSGELSISGERAGYTAIHPACEGGKEVFGALIHANRTLGFINCPALMQNVVRRLPYTSMYLKDYQRKRNYLFGKLVGMGYKVIKPAGGFFMLVKSPVKDDKIFVDELKKNLVLTVAGSEFQSPGYFRVSYCVENKTLEGAVAGFKKALESYK
jgi:aspartate aminotransferase